MKTSSPTIKLTRNETLIDSFWGEQTFSISGNLSECFEVISFVMSRKPRKHLNCIRLSKTLISSFVIVFLHFFSVLIHFFLCSYVNLFRDVHERETKLRPDLRSKGLRLGNEPFSPIRQNRPNQRWRKIFVWLCENGANVTSLFP